MSRTVHADREGKQGPGAAAQASPPTRPSPFADAFREGGWAKRGPGFVREARVEAMASFEASGWPAARGESWKNTPTRGLQAKFTPATAPAREVSEAECAPYRIPGALELVFVDGHHVPALSILEGVPRGLRIGPLSSAFAKPDENLEANYGRHAGDDAYVALNTAFAEDGAYIDIPRAGYIDDPIHLLHFATAPADPTASHVRHLIIAGPHSQATVIETYVGIPTGNPSLTTAVTEVVAGEGANLQRVKLQREDLHALHLGRVAIRQDRASVVQDHLLSVGGALARNEVDAILGMEGAELHLNGLFLGTGNQHVDCPTQIDHAVAHTTSRELYKGVLDGFAHGVFLGSVKVRADAQKTDSQQTNRNLLLSQGALVDSTPQLEIHADDVKCSHGSTIGQLSDDALFFLRSRGIDPEPARLILTKAFAHEVIEKAPAVVRPLMDQLLEQWFACRKVAGA